MSSSFSFKLFFVLFLTGKAFAFNGSIGFTDLEREAHAKALPMILSAAAECLKTDLQRQRDFYSKYGIAAYYGDRSAFSKLSDAQKRAKLVALHKDPKLLAQMTATSCVGLVRSCLGQGFAAGHETDLWKRLDGFLLKNDVDGSYLQMGLQKLGWKIYYWNPDVNQNGVFDREDQQSHPNNSDHFWGEHAENWSTVMRKRKYYVNTVDNFSALVDFKTQTPPILQRTPFFVGTAHMGYHVFPGTFGQVIEAHSTRAITDSKTVQTAAFNPLAGGGPTDGEYRSGIIALPPGE